MVHHGTKKDQNKCASVKSAPVVTKKEITLTDQQLKCFSQVVKSYTSTGVGKLQSFFNKFTKDFLQSWGKRIELIDMKERSSSKKFSHIREFCSKQIRNESNPEKLKCFLNELLSLMYFHVLLNNIILNKGENIIKDLSEKQSQNFEALKKCIGANYSKNDNGTRKSNDFIRESETFFPCAKDYKNYVDDAVKAEKALPKEIKEEFIINVKSIIGTISLFYDNIANLLEEPLKLRLEKISSFYHDHVVPALEKNKNIQNVVGSSVLTGVNYELLSTGDHISICPDIDNLNHLVNLKCQILIESAEFENLSNEYEDAFQLYLEKLDPIYKKKSPCQSNNIDTVKPIQLKETLQQKLHRIENSKTPLKPAADTIEPISIKDSAEVNNDDDTDEEKYNEQMLVGDPNVTFDLHKMNLSHKEEESTIIDKKETIVNKTKRLLSSDNESSQKENPRQKAKISNDIIAFRTIVTDDNESTFHQLPAELLSPISELSSPRSFEQDKIDLVTSPSVVVKIENAKRNELPLPDCCKQMYYTFYECMKSSVKLASECFEAVKEVIRFAEANKMCLFQLKQTVISVLHKVYTELYAAHLVSREKEMEKKKAKAPEVLEDEGESEDFIDDSSQQQSQNSSIISEDKKVKSKRGPGRPKRWHYVSRKEQGAVGKRYKRLLQFVGTEALLAFQTEKLDALDFQILQKIADGGFDNSFREHEQFSRTIDAIEEIVHTWGDLKDKPLEISKSALVDLLKISSRKHNSSSNNKLPEVKVVEIIKDFVDNKGKLTRKPREKKKFEEGQTASDMQAKKKSKKEKEEPQSSSTACRDAVEKLLDNKEEDAEAEFEIVTRTEKNTTQQQPSSPVNVFIPTRPTKISAPMVMQNVSDPKSEPISKISLVTFCNEMKLIQTRLCSNEQKTLLFPELNLDYIITLASMKELQALQAQGYISDANYRERFATLLTKLVNFRVMLCGRKYDNGCANFNAGGFLSYFHCLQNLLKRTFHFGATKELKALAELGSVDEKGSNIDLLGLIEKDVLSFKEILEKNEKDTFYHVNEHGVKYDISDIKLCLQQLEHAQKLLSRGTDIVEAIEDIQIDVNFYSQVTNSFRYPTMFFIAENNNFLLNYVSQQPNYESYFDWTSVCNTFSNELDNAFCLMEKRYACIELEGTVKELEYLQTAFNVLCSEIEKLVQRLEIKEEVVGSVIKNKATSSKKTTEQRKQNLRSCLAQGSNKEKLNVLKDIIKKASLTSNFSQQSMPASSISFSTSNNYDLSVATEIIDELLSQEMEEDYDV